MTRYYEQIENDIRKVMGRNTEINWFKEDQISSLPSGKYVYTLSEVE